MNKKYFPYLLLIPMIIVFSLFVGYPIILTILGSTVDFDGVFLGLSNFTKLFSDKILLISISNTVIITMIYLIIKIPLVVLISSLLYKLNKATKLFLTIFFIPTTIGMFTYGIIFRFMFSNDGIINDLFGVFGFHMYFLDNGFLAKVVIAIALVFSTFGTMVLFLLISMKNNISDEVYDASKIDGANFFGRLRYITLPILWPIISVFILFGIIECSSLIDIPYQLTGGGPNNQTITIGYYIYKQAISYGDFSYASAISLVTLLLIVSIVFIPRRMRGKYYVENY